MTRAFLRVERDGKWENIEVEELTKDELEEIIGSRSNAEIMDWLNLTCSVLRAVNVHFKKKEDQVHAILEEEKSENELDG